ncbi:MAG: hypothetical protein PHW83_09875 [Bacteroidales bacterium]|nr:hypothetical protein [Bacteroidales bacterium]
MSWRSIGGHLAFFAKYAVALREVEEDDLYDESVRRYARDLWRAFYVEYRTVCRAAGVDP